MRQLTSFTLLQYDADASITGRFDTCCEKCSPTILCIVRSNPWWNPLGKSAWRRRPETEPNVIWLHRDEAPEGLLNAVDGELPCVIADHGHRVEMLLDNEALKACEGDFATFTALLEEKLRALHSMQAPAAQNHPSG